MHVTLTDRWGIHEKVGLCKEILLERNGIYNIIDERKHGNNDAKHEVCHKSINDAKQVQNMIMQVCMVINEWFDACGLVTIK